MWAELAVTAFKLVVLGGAMLAAVPIMMWAERRSAALIQDRLGPNRVGPMGLLQPFADAVKLLFKEDLTPGAATKGLSFLAPGIALFVPLVAFIVIPFGAGHDVALFGVPLNGLIVAPDLEVGVLFLLAMWSLGPYGVVLAGWASTNTDSLMGGLRSSAQFISYELTLIVSILPVLLVTGSLKLTDVVARQEPSLWQWNVFPQFLGFAVFVAAVFAGTNRLPFDLAEREAAPAAGHHGEYSSMRFAAFFMSEYIHTATAAALGATLFLGGWTFPGIEEMFSGWPLLLVSVAVFTAKAALFMWVFVWVRWSMPRFRYDQLMDLGWKVLLPLAMLNLVVVAVLVSAGIL